MRTISTYLVTAEGVEEEYLWTCEKVNGHFVMESEDLPEIVVMCRYVIHGERQIAEILRRHWWANGVHIKVSKVYTTVLDDGKYG